MTDVIIIGAGVVGTNIARELSYYDISITVIDKNTDVCEETSKANSGIVHSGYDAPSGTLKAKYNVIGNQMMKSLCSDLDVPFEQNGSLIIGFSLEDEIELLNLKRQGDINGVKGLKILHQKEVLNKEPKINPLVYSALYAPTGGVVDPFQLTIASAEVASMNRAQFQLETLVLSVEKKNDTFVVHTDKGDFTSKILVNAAGCYSDHINNFLSQNKQNIKPRKGEYCLFDKQIGTLVHSTIFQLPTSKGKGVLVTPTVEGNLMVGPSSFFVEDKEDKETTIEGIRYVLETAKISVPEIPLNYIITGFAGLRASEESKDFIVGEQKDVENFFNASGIESPGLTAAPAIAKALADMIEEKHHFQFRKDATKKRTNITRFEPASIHQKKKLISMDKEYGKIVCRCEMVTLSEIKQAIHRPVGATTVDGIKRRTRAGFGRCQGGFCAPKVIEILAIELEKSPVEIAKSSKNSTFLIGLDKELKGGSF